MLKMKGLEKLQRQTEEARRVFDELDGTLGRVEFDASDPGSIDRAIRAMEEMIDSRVGRAADNPFVGPIAVQMKERYRSAILEKASAARLGAIAPDE